MPPTMLFLIFLAVLAIVLIAIWRYWASLASVSPEEEEYDERVAALNERQANRISDEQLTRPLSDEDAWQIMVRRGMRDRGRRRPERGGQRRLPAPRQDRYGGDLTRRVDERRGRYGERRREDE